MSVKKPIPTLTTGHVQDSMLKAGYETAICRSKENHAAPAGAATTMYDVFLEPESKRGKDKNFLALEVAKKLALQFRELQTFAGAVILRDCVLVETAETTPTPRSTDD